MQILKLNIQRFADGEVIIGITADSSDFDKKLYKLEKEQRKREVNVEVKAKDVEVTKSKISSLKKELKDVDKELDNISADAQRLAELELKGEKFGALSDKEQYEYMALSMSEVAEQEKALLDKRNGINTKIQESNNELTKQNQKLQEAKQLLEETKVGIESLKHNQITQEINNARNSMDGVIRKVAKWGLAIFGIRSMYMGIRQVVSSLLQEDEGLKAQVDYMKWAVGQAIKPIVEWLVNAVHQLLIWVGAIIKILFGINIFANATAKNFQKANGNAQKLKKTLAGFDEMNILNEDGSTGIAGGLANTLKDWDLAKEVDELSKKLEPFKEDIKALALLVAGIFGASVIAKWIGNIGKFLGSAGLGKLSSAISTLTVAAAGIVLTITILKKTWDDINKTKKEIQEIRKSAEKYINNWIDGEENIGTLLATNNAKRTAGLQLLADMHSLTALIYGLSEEQLKNAELVVKTNDKILQRAWELFNIDTASSDEKEKFLKELQTQIEYNKLVKKELEKQGKDTSYIDDINRDLISKTNIIYQNIKNTDEELYDLNSFELNDKNMTVNVDANMSEAVKKSDSWLNGLWLGVKNVGKAIASMTPLGGVVNAAVGVGSGIGSLWKKIFGAKGMLYTPPKLAVGGIINQPGRGVPLGSAFGGERGMEGVIPLTDSQQMALLGEAIGKYITINANITNTMNGRVISRELQKVQNDSDFAYNR